MIAASRFYQAACIFVVLALLASYKGAEQAWWIMAGIFLLVIVIDALLVFKNPNISIERELPQSLPLGVWQALALKITNPGNNNFTFDIHDHHPSQILSRGQPQTINLAAGTDALYRYDIQAVERGDASFPLTQIKLKSPLGFWHRLIKVENEETCRVHPNFAAVSKFALLALDNRLSQMGILKKRRRGEGQDFHQLRDYRKGDSLRQIDWKATSRMRKPISKEYQDERDQQIVMLLDCGYRMRTKDDDVSHFDQSLNATLLLSYVALRQGDAVGLGTFGGNNRWLAPVKGVALVKRILESIYDLRATRESPDYSQVARDLIMRQRKRSLVVMITNIRDSDSDDILPAVRLLSKQHLVLLVSMQEKVLDTVLDAPVNKLNDAVRLSATHEFIEHRNNAINKLRARGVVCIDTTPEDLSVTLVNAYLDIKSSGKL